MYNPSFCIVINIFNIKIDNIGGIDLYSYHCFIYEDYIMFKKLLLSFALFTSCLHASYLNFSGDENSNKCEVRAKLFNTGIRYRPELSRGSNIHLTIHDAFDPFKTSGTIDLFLDIKKKAAHIGLISIYKTDRRKGHATRALEVLLKSLKYFGFEAATLSVAPDNARALSIYTKLGFIVEPKAYQSGDMLSMTKRFSKYLRNTKALVRA